MIHSNICIRTSGFRTTASITDLSGTSISSKSTKMPLHSSLFICRKNVWAGRRTSLKIVLMARVSASLSAVAALVRKDTTQVLSPMIVSTVFIWASFSWGTAGEYSECTASYAAACTKFTHEAGFCTFTFILRNRPKANTPSQGPPFPVKCNIISHSRPTLAPGGWDITLIGA